MENGKIPLCVGAFVAQLKLRMQSKPLTAIFFLKSFMLWEKKLLLLGGGNWTVVTKFVPAVGDGLVDSGFQPIGK